MSRPRLLDLFCCAGGAGMGYSLAGFEVVGVDIVPQPHYPFEFHQADALEYLAAHGREFDAIHASPPCQAYSVTRHSHDTEHVELIEPTRALLEASGKPWIMENVEGALTSLRDPLRLCGTEFGLRAPDVDGTPLALQRHRLFESNVWLMGAGGCSHDGTQVAGVYGGGRHRNVAQRDAPSRRGGYTPAGAVRSALMGIDWMSQRELTQAIPPVYTEFLGRQLIEQLVVAA